MNVLVLNTPKMRNYTALLVKLFEGQFLKWPAHWVRMSERCLIIFTWQHWQMNFSTPNTTQTINYTVLWAKLLKMQFWRWPLATILDLRLRTKSDYNKANLRDFIAAIGLVILLKLDWNHRFFSPCDLEIWRMTFKNNRAPLLCYFKLCASFQCHWLVQTGVTVRKRPIWVKFNDF